MRVVKPSAGKPAGRIMRGRVGIKCAVATAMLAFLPHASAQTTYTWVGGAPQEESETASYGDIFSDWSTLGTQSRWEAGTIGKVNWRLSDDTIPTTVPGRNDNVIFGTGFASGNPVSRENREIASLLINTPTNIVLDFRDTLFNYKTLIVNNGLVRTNTLAEGRVGFIGNMLFVDRDSNNNPVAVDALLDLTGKSIDFRGQMQVSGSLVKTGPATADMTSGDYLCSVSGDVRIAEGELRFYNPIIGGDLIVGDGMGAADSAKLFFISYNFSDSVQERSFNNLTVRQDGRVELNRINRFDSITLDGGEFYFTGAEVHAPGLVAGPSNTGAAASIGSTTPTGSKLDLSGAPSGISVIELTGSAETDTALNFNTSLVAPNLVVKGNGIMTFGGVAVLQSAPLLNSVNQATIESGTVRVNRIVDDKILGTNITIGKAGETTPARLHLNAAVPFDATTDITLHQNGRLTAFNTTIDTLAFNGGGLVDSEGARSLTVNASSTAVTGSNAVATIRPNRMIFSSASHELNVAATNMLVVTNAVTASELRKTNSGMLRFSGNGVDDIDSLIVQSGTVELGRVGRDLTPGTFTVGLLNIPGPTIKWLTSDQLADSQSITFNAGTLDLNGSVETMGGFTASGTSTKAVTTGIGTLSITGGVTVNQGALVSTTGNIDLGGGSRSFSAGGNIVGQAGFTNLKFAGAINNGTFNKTGVGIVEFNTVTGTATLALSGGRAVSTGSTQFGGLTGSAPLEVQNGIFAVSNSSGQTSTYSGPISGAGGFHKRGAGELILSGTTPNTFTGGTTVANGTLVLDRDYDAIGDTLIAAAATVITRKDIQFYSSSDVTVMGQLDLDGKLQSINTLTLESTNPNSDATVRNGRILTSGAVKAKNGAFSDVALTVDSGGLELDASDAHIRGNIAGNSSLKNNSLLVVQTLGADATSLRFQNALNVADGSVLLFVLPNTPNAVPLLDVDGALLIGNATSQSDPHLLGPMNGVATIHLGLNVSMTEGTYALMQFGDYTSVGMTNSIVPTVAQNFTLVQPPNLQGELFIQNNTLYFTAIPEPGWLSGLGLATSLLLRRRPRHK